MTPKPGLSLMPGGRSSLSTIPLKPPRTPCHAPNMRVPASRALDHLIRSHTAVLDRNSRSSSCVVSQYQILGNIRHFLHFCGQPNFLIFSQIPGPKLLPPCVHRLQHRPSPVRSPCPHHLRARAYIPRAVDLVFLLATPKTNMKPPPLRCVLLAGRECKELVLYARR